MSGQAVRNGSGPEMPAATCPFLFLLSLASSVSLPPSSMPLDSVLWKSSSSVVGLVCGNQPLPRSLPHSQPSHPTPSVSPPLCLPSLPRPLSPSPDLCPESYPSGRLFEMAFDPALGRVVREVGLRVKLVSTQITSGLDSKWSCFRLGLLVV